MVTLLPKNGNAFFKKEKIFLLIFTCSKSPIKALEEGTKSVKFNTKRTNQYYQYHIKNKAPFGAPLSLHWRSKSLVRSAIEICLLHFLSANWLSWGQLYSYYGEDSLIQLMLISVFLSIFNFKGTRSLVTFSLFGAPRYFPYVLIQAW